MKKIMFRFATMLFLMTGLFFVTPAFSQTGGDPPPPPGSHGTLENEPPGGGSHVGFL